MVQHQSLQMVPTVYTGLSDNWRLRWCVKIWAGKMRVISFSEEGHKGRGMEGNQDRCDHFVIFSGKTTA